MSYPTHTHPHAIGDAAVAVVLVSIVVVFAMSVVSLVTPGPLDGANLATMLLAVAGVVVGVIVSEVSR